MNNQNTFLKNDNNQRFPREHAFIGSAAKIPVSTPTPVLSVSPVILPSQERMVDLEVRVTVPTTGSNLPIVLLSHGLGHSNFISSLYGYGPFVNFLASHGFVVIQPTHLDSRMLSLDLQAPDAPVVWKSRVEDMTNILDQLDAIVTEVPGLAGRTNHDLIAVIGHSMGALTAGMLLGEQLTMEDGTIIDMSDARIKAGVLLASPGNGGNDLSPATYEMFPFYRNPIFSKMVKPTLVIAGDADSESPWTNRGADWHTDPYTLSPGPKCLVTIPGGMHSLGGISGYDAAESIDENPERAATVARLTWAYLCSALIPENSAWSSACDVMAKMTNLGKVECK
ncbi:putative dienelactone hydrolase [Mobilisporobacter senegalensis]|uniref:Putative dienelactone hydrolase n=1 Tax=Mobilisporobacter senegalensis TaxID=1329262 RepID=A0A3N1XN32_9FIRM|nr:alpha/beta fold hydrolase [Mobilisporobacter senegalensis]ROR28076.1 putative dienelactone hydrolase [Mobilisporobacter senegalensis]